MANSNAPARKPPRISACDAKFATILVGSESDRFVVHEELLTYHSPSFRAALTGDFEEARRKEVRVAAVSKSVCEFFVHWLYHQRLPSEEDDPALFATWDSLKPGGCLKTANLIDLNVFCEMYDVPALRRLSLDHLFDHIVNSNAMLPSDKKTLYAFTNVADDSPLCRLLVDINCDYANKAAWDYIGKKRLGEIHEGFNEAALRAFLMQLLQRYTQYARGQRRSSSMLKICDYHGHKNEEERKVCATERKVCATERKVCATERGA